MFKPYTYTYAHTKRKRERERERERERIHTRMGSLNESVLCGMRIL